MKISSICKALGFIFTLSALVFPRVYGPQKLILLILLLAALALSGPFRKTIQITRPLVFFTCYATIFLVALVVGVIRGNSEEALIDGLRLGVFFPLILAMLWMFLSGYRYDVFLERVVLCSAFCISFLVFVAFFQNFIGIQILPDSFVEDNLFRVGLHDGYSQIVAHNIGSLFFIFGYLLYSVVYGFAGRKKLIWTFALILVLVAAMMSGRRALQFAILASPAFILFTSYLFAEVRLMRLKAIRWWLVLMAFVLSLLFYLFSNNYFYINGFVERFSGVFEDDGGARTSQAGALLSGFASYPFFGSGIGGVTSVVRSESAPWIFELTYFQILFNFGIIGSIAIFAIFLFEFLKIRSNSLRGAQVYGLADKSMVAGVLFLFFGAATNPYLGSFDFLLMVGVVPFVAAIGSRRRSQRRTSN